jgi:DNA-binding Xre family transcriptional regulator
MDELPVSVKRAREILGWGNSYMSAVRRAMGLTRRRVFISELSKFIRDHPGFTETQVYPRRSGGGPERLGTGGKISQKVSNKRTQEISKELQMNNEPANNQTEQAATRRPNIADAMQELAQWVAILTEGWRLERLKEATGLSRETLRKIKHGRSVKLGTLQKLRSCTKPSPEVWQNTICAWARLELGEEVGWVCIRPQPNPDSQSRPANSGELQALAARLSLEDTHQLVLTMTRPELRQVLPALNAIYESMRHPSSSHQEPVIKPAKGAEDYVAEQAVP